MICAVGLNCVDIVNFVPKYPNEDTDSRLVLGSKICILFSRTAYYKKVFYFKLFDYKVIFQ